jgi:hypothetical protein
MDPLLIVLRVVHVVGGVFWGGAILFVVHFLEPAVRDAGPDGAKVMQALQKRRYLDVMPVVAALTVVRVLALLARLRRWPRAWRFRRRAVARGGGSPPRRLQIGVSLMRPGAADRPPGRRLPRPSGAQRRDRGRVTQLRGRMRLAGRWVAALLGIAILCMAVGRYA